jgi:hypothetical protein
MTTTTALIVNAFLMAGIVGALAAVVRLAHRLPDEERPETLHPSEPIGLHLVLAEREDSGLARAA